MKLLGILYQQEMIDRIKNQIVIQEIRNLIAILVIKNLINNVSNLINYIYMYIKSLIINIFL
jgi:hypothetical protein